MEERSWVPNVWIVQVLLAKREQMRNNKQGNNKIPVHWTELKKLKIFERALEFQVQFTRHTYIL